MKVNLNTNKVHFYRNDKQIGNSIKIQSNTYYPAIAYGVYNWNGKVKVQLLSLK